MALISYREFLAACESRPSTRIKTASSLGLAPDIADVYGHATPPPWQVKRLLKQKRTNAKPIQEEKEQRPDYSFDRLVRHAVAASQEIDDEIEKVEDEMETIERKKQEKKKQLSDRSKKEDEEKKRKRDLDAKKSIKDSDSPELQPAASKQKPESNKAEKEPEPQQKKSHDTEVKEWLYLLGDQLPD